MELLRYGILMLLILTGFTITLSIWLGFKAGEIADKLGD